MKSVEIAKLFLKDKTTVKWLIITLVGTLILALLGIFTAVGVYSLLLVVAWWGSMFMGWLYDMGLWDLVAWP